ncbi:hypothetical protein PUF88_00705 [Lactobacillaceae bacterium L1_55_11]|nr:hypothetical protein [Lactobacillaceae bacterium L1_55_11]
MPATGQHLQTRMNNRGFSLSANQKKWLNIAGMVLGLNLIWWQQALAHPDIFNRAEQWQLWTLLIYSLSCGLSVALLIKNRFQGRGSYVLWALSMVVMLNPQVRSRFEIATLLFLFSTLLILLPQNILRLKNGLGLIVFSVLSTYAVPVSLFYLANNYLTDSFVGQSWLVLYAFLFFFTPLFLPNARGRLLSLVTLAVYWIAALVQLGFHISALLATLFSLPVFLFQFNKRYFTTWQPLCSIAFLTLTLLIVNH